MFSGQYTKYVIFLLRKSRSRCKADLVASVELIYDVHMGKRQEDRPGAKTGGRALHMQLVDRFKLPYSVYFGNCLVVRVLTNKQVLTDFHWLDSGRYLYIYMLHANSMSSLLDLKSDCGL